jgi:hypothetical protein
MNNNEPVAWMQMTNKQCVTKISFVQTWADDVPLYTHPVKELTDDEILELWSQKNNLNGAQDILDFARAILRKAQEK